MNSPTPLTRGEERGRGTGNVNGGTSLKPYAKAQTIPLKGLADRRRVLTDRQKAEIRELYAKGDIGTRPLARMFGCSRSLICIIVNPERAEKVKARFKAHWKDYSIRRGKAYHAKAMRNHRNYKYGLLKEGLLKPDEAQEEEAKKVKAPPCNPSADLL